MGDRPGRKMRPDELEVTGVSRSGRVRKKSSLLADFESPDEIDPRYKRKVDRQREKEQLAAIQARRQSSKEEEDEEDEDEEYATAGFGRGIKEQPKERPRSKPVKVESFEQSAEVMYQQAVMAAMSSGGGLVGGDDGEDDEDEESFDETEGYYQMGAPMMEQSLDNEEEEDEPMIEEEEVEEEEDGELMQEEAYLVGDEEVVQGMVHMDSADPLDVGDDDDEVDPGFDTTTDATEEDEEDSPSFKKHRLMSQADSVYFTEKSRRPQIATKMPKPVVTPPVVSPSKAKPQRKDKGKTRFTAYMLWAKETRPEIVRAHPEMDFVAISKRLGEMWSNVPNLEKYNWKRRARRLAQRGTMGNLIMTGHSGGKGGKPSVVKPPMYNRPQTSSALSSQPSTSAQQSPRQQTFIPVSYSTAGRPASAKGSPTKSTTSSTKSGPVVAEPVVGPGMYKVVGMQPIDVAAHLKLLGESLTIIGQRLKEHEGQIAVSGSLSVLLDSLLCATGPLLCLTQQVPETNACKEETLAKILDNIAYIMPGL